MQWLAEIGYPTKPSDPPVYIRWGDMKKYGWVVIADNRNSEKFRPKYVQAGDMILTIDASDFQEALIRITSGNLAPADYRVGLAPGEVLLRHIGEPTALRYDNVTFIKPDGTLGKASANVQTMYITGPSAWVTVSNPADDELYTLHGSSGFTGKPPPWWTSPPAAAKRSARGAGNDNFAKQLPLP